MSKILLNKCYGGYGFSNEAIQVYMERKYGACFFYTFDDDRNLVLYQESDQQNIRPYYISWVCYREPIRLSDLSDDDAQAFFDICEFGESYEMREDPLLIDIVEELGEAANGSFAALSVVEIPDRLSGGNYVIDSYDGMETVHEYVEKW